MKSKVNDRELVVFLEGKLDTDNAEEVKAEIEGLLESSGKNELVFDFDDLNYISSAGLRIVMNFSKRLDNVEIINANETVYNIFEMTGFNAVIPVKRGTRKFNSEDLELIGVGPNAITYKFDDETTIKVFSDEHVSKEDVDADRIKAQKAFLKGIPTAIPFDVVMVDDSYGVVYEMVNQGTLLNHILENPEEIPELAHKFGQFMNQMHQIDMGNEDEEIFTDQKRVFVRALNKLEDQFSKEDFFKLKMVLGKIPLMNNFSHGDFHPGNVFLRDDEFMLMDMMAVGKGSPLFDIMSLYCFTLLPITIKGAEDSKKLTREQSEAFFDNALKGYFDTEDEEYLQKIKDMVSLLAPLREYLLLNYIYDPQSSPETKEEVEKFKKMVSENMGMKISKLPFNIF